VRTGGGGRQGTGRKGGAPGVECGALHESQQLGTIDRAPEFEAQLLPAALQSARLAELICVLLPRPNARLPTRVGVTGSSSLDGRGGERVI